MASGAEVVLQGQAMVGLIRAVEGLSEAGLDRYVVVGGLGVAARLGQAHRATTDVDAVFDETAHPDAVEALLALPTSGRTWRARSSQCRGDQGRAHPCRARR